MTNINPTQLSEVVGLLAALSVASERLVEIIKGFIPSLDKKETDANQETWRRAKLHLIAVGCGIITALVSGFALPDAVQNLLPKQDLTSIHYWTGAIVLGFLASGGSG